MNEQIYQMVTDRITAELEKGVVPLAPVIGGLLIEYFTWHYIFWISLPFLIIGLLIGLKYLENVTEVTKPRIDLLSIALSTIGFGGVVFGFSKAGEGSEGWGSAIVITSIIAGIVALMLFILRQNMMHDPMMNLSVFKYPMYVIGLLLVLSCMVIIMSSMIILPMFLQTGAGLSVFTARLMLLPGSALNGILSPRMGQLLFCLFNSCFIFSIFEIGRSFLYRNPKYYRFSAFITCKGLKKRCP